MRNAWHCHFELSITAPSGNMDFDSVCSGLVIHLLVNKDKITS